MKKLLFLGFAAGLCLFSQGALRSVTPAVPDAPWTKGWWMPRHEQKMQLVKAGGAPIVFLGDSITHFWEDRGRDVWNRYFASGRYRAINLGFSGDRTEHVLWRIEQGELEGYAAKAVVLMLGTNNTGHFPFDQETPEDTIVGLKAVLDAIRAKQPQAKIVLCSIFPRDPKPTGGNRLRNGVVNKEIQKFCDGRNILWCDFGQQFLTADGTLTAEVAPDFLHPAPAGYEVWASAVLPFLDFALDAKPGDERVFPQRFAATVEPTQFAVDGPSTVIPATQLPDQVWWKTRLREKRTEIVDGPKEYDVVFVGDSITHRWERPDGGGEKVWAELKQKYTLLNLGIGGDGTQHVLWRMKYGELEGYRTKLFVLMIGTNNRDRPEQIAQGVKKILETLRAKHPEAKVLLHPIFPRGKTAQDGARKRNEAVNAIIRGYADGTDVLWHDFNAKFLDEKGGMKPGLMFPDDLHPDHNGYLLWRDELLPIFQKVLGK